MRKRRKKRVAIVTPILFTVLELLSIFIIVRNNDIQKSNVTESVRAIQAWMWKATSNIDYYTHLKVENEILARENAKIRRELDRFRSLADEYMAEAGAEKDDTVRKYGFSYIPARIIHNSTVNKNNYILLDKGEKDGIRENMGVITPDGILGIVNAVSDNACSVISVLSKEISISVKLKSTGVFCPMVWDEGSSRKAKLIEIPPHITVMPGDSILTSGYSSIFPPDIPVGTVESWQLGKRGLIEAKVNLFEDYSSVRHVTVVANEMEQEINSLTGRK